MLMLKGGVCNFCATKQNIKDNNSFQTCPHLPQLPSKSSWKMRKYFNIGIMTRFNSSLRKLKVPSSSSCNYSNCVICSDSRNSSLPISRMWSTSQSTSPRQDWKSCQTSCASNSLWAHARNFRKSCRSACRSSVPSERCVLLLTFTHIKHYSSVLLNCIGFRTQMLTAHQGATKITYRTKKAILCLDLVFRVY